MIMNAVDTSKPRYKLTSLGSDFFLNNGNESFPLDWGECTISFADLRDILRSEAINVVKFKTDDVCKESGCDGYDYSNCDWSRCKNDCKRCRGRKYVCDNRCFYYRYKVAVKLVVDKEAIYEMISPVLKRLKDANAAYCENYRDIYFQIEKDIERIRKALGKASEYFVVDEYAELNKELLVYNKLADARDNARIKLPLTLFGIRVAPHNIAISRHGLLLWKKWHIESIGEAYDSTKDRFVRFDFKLLETDENVIKRIVTCIKEQNQEELNRLLSQVKIKSKKIEHYVYDVKSD